MRVRSRKGVTLVETLVALMVMSIAALVLIGVFPSVLHLDKGSQFQSKAVALAQETLDQFLRLSKSVTANQSGWHPGATPSDAPQQAPPGLTTEPPRYTTEYGGNYTVTWTPFPDPLGRPDLQMLGVQVSWLEPPNGGGAGAAPLNPDVWHDRIWPCTDSYTDAFAGTYAGAGSNGCLPR